MNLPFPCPLAGATRDFVAALAAAVAVGWVVVWGMQ